jgi:hypothetical protein
MHDILLLPLLLLEEGSDNGHKRPRKSYRHATDPHHGSAFMNFPIGSVGLRTGAVQDQCSEHF